jgi:hypothetical protein
MSRLTFSILACLICSALFQTSPPAAAQEKTGGRQETPPSWVKVAPEGAGFSVLMPGSPKETADSINYAAVKVPGLLYDARVGEAVFFAGRFGDFPEQLVKEGYVDLLFENAHKIFFESKRPDGTTDTLRYTVRDITRGGHAGREYNAECGPHKKVDGPCGGVIRVFKSGAGIFVVGFAGPKSILTEELTGKFLSSFALTN